MREGKSPPRPTRRRSTRMVLRVALLINSADPSIPAEWEHVETRAVSRHGGLVSTQQFLPVGAILDVRRRDRERSARARVVWRSEETTPRGTDIGFEIVDDDDFWEIAFPPDRFSDNAQT